MVTTKEWDLLQTYDHHTLICIEALCGTGGAWRTAVADLDVIAEVEDVQQLIGNLGRVKRSAASTTQAVVLLMPSQAFMKRTIEEQPQTTNDELVCEVEKAAEVNARYYVDCNLQNPAPDGEPWSLEATLGCFESFYVLEALHQRWSQCHLFKYNCPECFKTASCVRCILASMVCNATIHVPGPSLGATIQGRCRRGRPSARGSDVGDVGEARSRSRIELAKE